MPFILTARMICLPLGRCGLVVFVCTSVIVQSFEDSWDPISLNRLDLDDFLSQLDDERKARTTSLALQGIFAVNKLLKGAERVKDYSYQFRKYVKEGDANSAIKDFYSIKPTNRKLGYFGIERKSKPGTVLTGLAGDRRVVLLIDGDKWSQGRPVLEVIDTKIKTKPNIDRIVYKELK